jgi:hypothetical protein
MPARRFSGKGAAGAAVVLVAGAIVGAVNVWLLVAALPLLLVIYAFCARWEKKHPPPPDPHIATLLRQMQELTSRMGGALPSQTPAPTIVRSAPKKGRPNWEAMHEWGPDAEPIAFPGVVMGVQSTDGEQLGVSRIEVDDPDGDTLTFDFTGAAFHASPLEALRRLQPSASSGIYYPEMFTEKAQPLRDGTYTVRWYGTPNGISETLIAEDEFEMKDGALC